MEVAGDSVGTVQLGPFTSTPRESPPPSDPPQRTDSSTSLSSESSGEDWLIKVCCPGARHRYRRHAKTKKRMSSQPQKTEFPNSLDGEEDLTKCAEWMPVTSYQTYPGVPKQESSDLEWLIRLRCPRAQMEEMRPDAKQRGLSFHETCERNDYTFQLVAAGTGLKTEESSSCSAPHFAASFEVNTETDTGINTEHILATSKSLSRSSSKTRSTPPERSKIPESWLTKKHFSIAQALVNERQDVDSAQSMLERENCFVREVDRYLKHSDFLALRRKEMLYKKWFENVSRPLLQKIQDKIDRQSSEEIEERKRKQLSLYLNHCNKKGGASLESYSPSSYDPFFLKTCTDIWKVSVPPLCDPLLKEIQERYLEAGIIQQCDTGKIFSPKEMNELYKVELPLLPLSRQLMSPVEWLKIPSGYMESEVRQRSRQKMIPTRNQSSMDFRSWGDPSGFSANKRSISARKPDIARTSNPLTKQMSVWKSAIKSAS